MLIGPLTFSDIYIILHNVAFFVLMSVLTSTIILPQLFNLNSKKLSTFNGRNLHLITDFVMLIWNFPCKAFIVLLLLFVSSNQRFITHFKFNFVLCTLYSSEYYRSFTRVLSRLFSGLEIITKHRTSHKKACIRQVYLTFRIFFLNIEWMRSNSKEA